LNWIFYSSFFPIGIGFFGLEKNLGWILLALSLAQVVGSAHTLHFGIRFGRLG